MRTFVIASAIIHNEGKYLIGKRSPSKEFAPGQWEFISGFVEEKESAEDTVLRELKEELGAEGTIIDTADPYSFQDSDARWIVIPFVIKLKNIAVKVNPEDHSEIKWIAADELSTIYELKRDAIMLKSRGLI